MDVTPTWARELRVLKAAVAYFEEHEGMVMLDLETLETLTEMPEVDVHRAVRALQSADPPFLVGIEGYEMGILVEITSVTERARVAVGQWPNPEQIGETLLAQLNAEIESEPNDDRRSRMQSAASVLGSMLRDVAVRVAAQAAGMGW